MYRARALVGAPSFLVPASSIRSRLEDEGFSAVSVYKSPDDVPADWPQDQRADPSSFGSFTAYVEATWNKPDESRDIPSEVIGAWIAKSAVGDPLVPQTSEKPGSHPWAREILRRAWAQVFDETPNESTMQAVQAVAWHESQYGFALTLPDGSPSNNWGSVQQAGGWKGVACTEQQTCPPGSFVHQDRNAAGQCYLGCYRFYPEPLLGALDFVRTLCGVRPKVRGTIGYGNATAIAREMRASGYFEDTIANYAAGIERGASTIAGALKEPVYVTQTSVVRALVGWGAVAGLGFFAYRKGVAV